MVSQDIKKTQNRSWASYLNIHSFITCSPAMLKTLFLLSKVFAVTFLNLNSGASFKESKIFSYRYELLEYHWKSLD